MIVVARDREGIKLVLAQMLEREYDLFRLQPQLAGKSPEHTAYLLGSVARVTLSPGYERYANHLMLLERYHKLGLPLGELLATELAGLEVLDAARMEHKLKHPNCYACGMPQPNRFQTACVDCAVKYSKRSR